MQVRETAAEQLMRALVQSKSSWVKGKLLLKPEACDLVFKYARIYGDTEVKEVTSIFRATRDGWTTGDFHRLCDNRGPTLCLLQTNKDYMSAGFTSIAWSTNNTNVEDASAMVFALTDKLQAFKTKNPEKAVYYHMGTGPLW